MERSPLPPLAIRPETIKVLEKPGQFVVIARGRGQYENRQFTIYNELPSVKDEDSLEKAHQLAAQLTERIGVPYLVGARVDVKRSRQQKSLFFPNKGLAIWVEVLSQSQIGKWGENGSQ